ncbi:hypothetical protein TNCV_1738851 [Trichonephila clavipes]|nr:hypothetical protein TNCV_1738851 [Trichonephila clavipes]
MNQTRCGKTECDDTHILPESLNGAKCLFFPTACPPGVAGGGTYQWQSGRVSHVRLCTRTFLDNGRNHQKCYISQEYIMRVTVIDLHLKIMDSQTISFRFRGPLLSHHKPLTGHVDHLRKH